MAGNKSLAELIKHFDDESIGKKVAVMLRNFFLF